VQGRGSIIPSQIIELVQNIAKTTNSKQTRDLEQMAEEADDNAQKPEKSGLGYENASSSQTNAQATNQVSGTNTELKLPTPWEMEKIKIIEWNERKLPGAYDPKDNMGDKSLNKEFILYKYVNSDFDKYIVEDKGHMWRGARKFHKKWSDDLMKIYMNMLVCKANNKDQMYKHEPGKWEKEKALRDKNPHLVYEGQIILYPKLSSLPRDEVPADLRPYVKWSKDAKLLIGARPDTGDLVILNLESNVAVLIPKTIPKEQKDYILVYDGQDNVTSH